MIMTTLVLLVTVTPNSDKFACLSSRLRPSTTESSRPSEISQESRPDQVETEIVTDSATASFHHGPMLKKHSLLVVSQFAEPPLNVLRGGLWSRLHPPEEAFFQMGNLTNSTLRGILYAQTTRGRMSALRSCGIDLFQRSKTLRTVPHRTLLRTFSCTQMR